MTTPTKRGYLIISHGSPRAKANESFERLVGRVASRLEGAPVLPAFFSLAHPTILEQVERLAAQGVSEINLLPYFLHGGQHVTVDIPAQVAACRLQFPNARIELLATLQDDPWVEDILVDRLVAASAQVEPLKLDGPGIARRSEEIIDRRLALTNIEPAMRPVVRRVIHSTADFTFAETLRWHPQALERGVQALRAGGPVICDVTMLKAGVTHCRSEALCAIGDADVAQRAREAGTTRAAEAMEKLADRFPGAIVAIGNAPTALWKVLEIAQRGGPQPALVVGVPVGFVGARESKLALMQSALCHISNLGPRGGTPVAAAIVNALASLEKEGSGRES